MPKRNSEFIQALSLWVMSNANQRDGVTAKEMQEHFKVTQPTISRALKHPGFKYSIRPVWPRGYWFDSSEVDKLVDALSGELDQHRTLVERLETEVKPPVFSWLNDEMAHDVFAQIKAMPPNQRQDLLNRMVDQSRLSRAVTGWNNAAAHSRNAVESKLTPNPNMEWLPSLKTMVRILCSMIEYYETDPRRGTPEEWAIFLSNLE